jgi:hypothetical protein
VITIVMPVSVIPSHPDTDILTETVESVRHHLPDAEIILTFDGIRDAQADRKSDYAEAIRRILWKADHCWGKVAAVEFYRRILTDHFSEHAKCFIEDKMHGVASEAYICEGMDGWRGCRLHIYAPEGDIKRSWHSDGRAGGSKYEADQVF